jgi:hypothetical protein
MHDSAELFLAAACSHHNVGKRDMRFAEYFSALEPKLGRELEYRMSMLRLNAARVMLKHQGVWPHRADVYEFLEVTDAFLNANCEALFDFPLHKASLREFIEPEAARQSLEASESELEAGDLESAAVHASNAFAYIEHHFGLYRLLSPIGMASRVLPYGEFVELQRFLENLERQVHALQANQVIAQLGVTQAEYETFRRSVPYSAITMAGTPHTTSWGNQTYTADGVRDSIRFVEGVGLALRRAHPDRDVG